MRLYDTAREAIQCPKCLKWWQPGNTGCAVEHVGDGCCHYGDTEVTEDGQRLRPPPPSGVTADDGTSLDHLIEWRP